MNNLSLGEKIKFLRKKNGMTQQQIAHLIPTSFSTFRRWEKNLHSPNVFEISRLAQILNTSVSYLTDEVEIKKSDSQLNSKEQSITTDKGMMTYYFSNGEKIEMPAIPELVPAFQSLIAQRLAISDKN